MPHFPKPFFKAKRGVWYVEIDRHQHSLGSDEQEAFQKYHELMAQAGKPTAEPAPTQVQLVVNVFGEFLEWCQKHKAPLTYVWYRDRIQAFIRTIPPALTVPVLKPIHVERWVDAHPEWSPSHQRGCKVAVGRAFSWADKMGVIDKNPIRHLEKPEAGKREQLVSASEYGLILGHFPDRNFRELIEMAWHTGARPQETIRIEARHVDLSKRRIELPPKEAKGKKRYRIIYLNDHALELVRKRVSEYPTGPIFRNLRGNPWEAAAVNNRFCRLQQYLGRRKLGDGLTLDPEEVKAFAATLRPEKTVKGKVVQKTERDQLREARKKLRARAAARHGTKFCLYAFRHTFANRLLAASVDSLTVSTLLGHVDGTMLTKVYQHLQQNADHLLRAVNSVTPVNAAG